MRLLALLLIATPAFGAGPDQIVSVYMAKHGVAAPRPISDAAFARRVYLDAWGLLPSPEQLQAFLEDRSLDKRERLIATLLADNDMSSQKYAENWITFWNDLLRNDEGVNYAGSRKTITAWLMNAVKTNLPYDQFVTKLLNPTAPNDPDGFLIGVNWRGDISASQTPAMQAAQNTAQIFLGVNLKCNSCHDSFISHWKLRDAYQLAGYFAPEVRQEMYRCDAPTGQFADISFLYPALDRPPATASLTDRHATAAAIFTDPRNKQMPRTLVNRIWQRLLGRGIVEPVDEMESAPWSPELLDWLAADFVEHRYDIKHLIATILASRAYAMPAVIRRTQPSGPYVFRGPEIRRMTAEQFADAVGAITGEWRVYQPDRAKLGEYTREWRVASTSMTRALGRPIRDQVITTRSSEATTLQGLEMVNGEVLTHWLTRGAKRMLGELPPEPVSLFDSGLISSSDKPPDPVEFHIDISGAKRLWLLVADKGSYTPELADPVWVNPVFIAPDGVTPITALKPVATSGERPSTRPIEYKDIKNGQGLRVMSASIVEYDISDMRFTHFAGSVTVENTALHSDIIPQVRFFVFKDPPNLERLVPVASLAPVGTAPAPHEARELVDRVFWHALGRAPTPGERRVAESAVGNTPSAAGLADLLWSLLMSPEFQLIT